jgi:hypothetical protein
MITMKSPKFKFLSVLFFSLVFNAHAQVQTIWTEDFNNGCTGGCYASAFNGINGAWSVTSPGANGNVANDWFVSGAECGMLPGQCGIDCGATNASLHISVNVSIMGIDLIDLGAAYLAGGAALGGDATTNRRAESPVINSTGFTNLQLSFSYIENGQGSIDNAEVWIFDGATWALLADMAKTNCCDGACPSCVMFVCNLCRRRSTSQPQYLG